MTGFNVVSYKGKSISILDLSNAKASQAIETLKFVQDKISDMPLKSVLILLDETNTEVTKEGLSAVMEFAKNNTPYVKASAVVGAEKLKGVMLTNVSTEIGRDISSFATRAQAMDWLVSQL